MQILVVSHGPPPAPGRFCSGGALRAHAHAAILQHGGHRVHLLCREQDAPGGFRSPADLRQKAALLAPDWILCVAPGEAPALAGIAPLVVDLYAPRLLESAWEGAEVQAEEAGRTLRAIHAADEVLFSNPRQRWFYAGVLGLCGWDLREAPGLLVPLCTAPEELRPAAGLAAGAGLAGLAVDLPERFFVMGGVPWPWQDASAALAAASRHLQARGDGAEILTVGLPPERVAHLPGVRALPPLPFDQWLALCGRAVAALDRYAPNPERELALSFRQMDFLSAGLPLISGPEMVLAAEIRETGAGWVDEPLEEALDRALDRAAQRGGESPERIGARALAARYHPLRTGLPLLGWVPVRHSRGRSAVRDAARFARAEERARRERARRETAEAEVAAKRLEITAEHDRSRALTASVESLSAAIADVAGFRREAATVLGARLSGEHALREQLQRELEIARAELGKKDMEIAAMRSEQGRLEGVIRRVLGR